MADSWPVECSPKTVHSNWSLIHKSKQTNKTFLAARHQGVTPEVPAQGSGGRRLRSWRSTSATEWVRAQPGPAGDSVSESSKPPMENLHHLCSHTLKVAKFSLPHFLNRVEQSLSLLPSYCSYRQPHYEERQHYLVSLPSYLRLWHKTYPQMSSLKFWNCWLFYFFSF